MRALSRYKSSSGVFYKPLHILWVLAVLVASVALWATSAQAADRLAAGGALTANQYLESPNKGYRFYLQGDGNLVLRDMNTSQARWASGTNGKNGVRLAMQGDGNLVLYTASGAAVWASGTNGKGATLLRLFDNGALALLNGSTSVWSVNGTPPSYCHQRL